MDIKETIDKAISAIGEEIKAVRETPSHDVLVNGEKEKKAGHHVYVFETTNQGLRFAEEIKARIDGGKEQKGKLTVFYMMAVIHIVQDAKPNHETNDIIRDLLMFTGLHTPLQLL